MNQADAIEKLLKDTGHTKTHLSELMGYSRPTGISNMLKRGNIEVDTLCKICKLLDYEVTIQPKSKGGARTKGQIVIDAREAKK